MAPSKPKEHSREDFLVAFGPNDTYLARAPGGILQSSLVCSPELQKNIAQAKAFDFAIFPALSAETATSGSNEDASTNTIDTVSGPEIVTLITSHKNDPDPYLGWTKKDMMSSHKLYQPPEKYYPELGEWLDHRWGTDLQVISNAHGSWWALSPASGNMKWKALPTAVRQLVKPTYPHGAITHMALGVNDSYVVVFKDGHVQWDLKGMYDMLDAYLQIYKSGDIAYVSLSPYQENRFFIAFKDSTVLYEFDQSWTKLDEAFLECDDLRVIIDSETVRHTHPSSVQKRSTLKNLAMGVVTSAVEGAVSGDMQAVASGS